MAISDIEHNPLLFGRDERARVIAVEPVGRFMRVFYRDGGQVHFRDETFQPFILVSEPSVISGCQVPCSVRELAGTEQFRVQLLFESWHHCLTARDFLAARSGKPPGAADAPYLFLPDSSHQYMLASGVTLFKEMAFSELRCLALDIETACADGYDFSNPDRLEDRIIAIALVDSYGKETVLRGDLLDEQQLLQALNDAIHECDPDVITGHNLFRFDLDYIARRAERHNIRLNWGRNGAPPHITPHARWNLAEKTLDYPRWDVYGRHLVDTWFLVQLYDVSGRNLPGHGLKEAARYFGLAAEDRTYLEGGAISGTFAHDPELLYRYNLDDARETLALFRLLGYPWFLQSRIFPYSLQNCIVRGNATRINALFVREYLHRGHAVPARTAVAVPFEGGYTESVRQGVIRPVVHCDVASLYPSLMLTYRLAPQKDVLGLFLPLLAELRRFRLEAKQAEREADNEADQHYYSALQQVFKVLINSFYGYLGSVRHNFSDPVAAAEVTRLGRVTIRNMIDLLVGEGAEPVEVDTDGIYFRPPPGCADESAEQELVGRLSRQLPAGIDVECDGRYRAMFAYKTKNYALQDYAGRLVIKGSSLRSRGTEPYLREYTRDVIECLLNGDSTRLERLFGEYVTRLRARTLDVEWVARTETLTESPATYLEKLRSGRRNRSAAFEVALAAPERVYRSGDHVRYYVSGAGRDVTAYDHCRAVSCFDPAHPDINISYYVEKLHHTMKRFEAFMPAEPTLFPL